MDIGALKTSLEAGQIAPFYLVVGGSTWHRTEAVRMVRAATVPEADRALAEIRGRIRECDLVSLLDSARTLPMGVARRLVVLSDGDELKKEEIAQLLDYAASPRLTSTVVLCAAKLTSGEESRRLTRRATVVTCPEPRNWEVGRWIRAEMTRRELAHDAGVPEALQALLGDAPRDLAAGLDKLELYIEGRGARRVGVDDVESSLSRLPHGTVWQFIEALENRDTEASLAALAAILELGEPPESVLRLVLRSRRQIMAGLAAAGRGEGDDGILQAMGTSPRARQAPRVRRAILERLRRHRLDEVVESLPLLLAADSRLKGGGGGGGPGVVLTRLVLDLVSTCRTKGLAPSRFA
ncbi:MAG: DNA polymerase III subunit delta [Acidobacteriota bacterium]